MLRMVWLRFGREIFPKIDVHAKHWASSRLKNPEAGPAYRRNAGGSGSKSSVARQTASAPEFARARLETAGLFDQEPPAVK